MPRFLLNLKTNMPRFILNLRNKHAQFFNLKDKHNCVFHMYTYTCKLAIHSRIEQRYIYVFKLFIKRSYIFINYF